MNPGHINKLKAIRRAVNSDSRPQTQHKNPEYMFKFLVSSVEKIVNLHGFK
jgi:hypothetical protein